MAALTGNTHRLLDCVLPGQRYGQTRKTRQPRTTDIESLRRTGISPRDVLSRCEQRRHVLDTPELPHGTISAGDRHPCRIPPVSQQPSRPSQTTMISATFHALPLLSASTGPLRGVKQHIQRSTPGCGWNQIFNPFWLNDGAGASLRGTTSQPPYSSIYTCGGTCCELGSSNSDDYPVDPCRPLQIDINAVNTLLALPLTRSLLTPPSTSSHPSLPAASFPPPFTHPYSHSP